jgi:hypothetical protein
MKKIFFLFFIFSLSGFPVSAQKFTYPVIPKTGGAMNDFLPKNWIIISSSNVDMNKDGRNDILIFIGYKDTLKDKLDDNQEVLWEPRILIVCFKDSVDDNYHLVLQDHKFIPDKGSGEGMDGMDPYMSDVNVSSKGILEINLGCCHTTLTYKFRYQKNAFYLIGATRYDVEGAGSEFERWDFNFLTKKYDYTRGEMSTDKNNGAVTKSFNFDKLKTLQELDGPQTWEVLHNVFI